jgi:hypothetical protein
MQTMISILILDLQFLDLKGLVHKLDEYVLHHVETPWIGHRCEGTAGLSCHCTMQADMTTVSGLRAAGQQQWAFWR